MSLSSGARQIARRTGSRRHKETEERECNSGRIKDNEQRRWGDEKEKERERER